MKVTILVCASASRVNPIDEPGWILKKGLLPSQSMLSMDTKIYQVVLFAACFRLITLKMRLRSIKPLLPSSSFLRESM